MEYLRDRCLLVEHWPLCQAERLQPLMMCSGVTKMDREVAVDAMEIVPHLQQLEGYFVWSLCLDSSKAFW